MNADRQSWHDAWRDLQFLRSRIAAQYCATPDEYENRAQEIEFNLTEADKIRAHSMGIII